MRAYEAWCATLGPGELHAYRTELEALRPKVVQAYEASAEARVLDAVQRHRSHFHYITKGRGARVDRNRRSVPLAVPAVSFMAVNVARRHRERLLDGPVETRFAGGYDVSDARAWKAPEAMY